MLQLQYKIVAQVYTLVLAIFEKALGPDHPSVASALNNLASLYKEEARYARSTSGHWRSGRKRAGPTTPLSRWR